MLISEWFAKSRSRNDRNTRLADRVRWGAQLNTGRVGLTEREFTTDATEFTETGTFVFLRVLCVLCCKNQVFARRREATKFSAPPATINSCAAGLSGGNGNDFPSTVRTDLA